MSPSQIKQKLDALVQHADDIRAVFPQAPKHASDNEIKEIRGLLHDHRIFIEQLDQMLFSIELDRFATIEHSEEE